MAKKTVVVLGAGFGGLRAAMSVAKNLRRMRLLEKYEVVLVDRNDCHLYTPLLYKVAAGIDGDYEAKCTYAVSNLVKNLPIRFVESEITAIDIAAGNVSLKTGAAQIRADYLVVAIGSETNYFGIPGLKENSLPMKSVNDALAVRSALSRAFAKSGKVTIVAGGAGPNGIELAAQIRGWADRMEEEDRTLKVSVSLVEAMPTILPGLHPRAAAFAWNRLQKLGIAVRTNAKIISVAPNEISIGGVVPTNGIATSSVPGETIPFDVFIWTGGIKTPDMAMQLPIEKDTRGKPLAKSDMRVSGTVSTTNPETVPDTVSVSYSVGDAVTFMNPKTNKPVPAVARAAINQGSVTARNIIEEIKKSENADYRPSPRAFRPSNYPYVIPVGENWAVAKIGPVVFSGWLGGIFEKLIALNYLLSIMPLEDAFKAWHKM